MPSSTHLAALSALPVDDNEIGRLALLVDSLGIALVVHAADGAVCLRNSRAVALLGETTPTSPTSPIWLAENGEALAHDEQPLIEALNSGLPVRDRIVGIANLTSAPTWLKTSALPILADDGSIRRVLLLLLDVSREKQLVAEVEKLSLHDPLTGVSCQAHIEQLLENEVHRARRYGTPFVLAQIDIDQFQPFCASHGTKAGEQLLIDFARLLRGTIREIDMIGRVANDEFLLILPNVNLNEAMIGLERIRAVIEAHDFPGTGLKVTLSGGVSEYTGESGALLIERVRALLLQAWDSGRNQLCIDMDIF